MIRNFLKVAFRNLRKTKLFSFVVAAPLSYWGLTICLESFSKRMSVDILFPLIIILLTAGLTIVLLVFYAARKNPVDTLEYE